jgi:hypothetical protein
MYADYKYYTNKFEGVIIENESSFNALAHKAERYLDYVCHERVSKIMDTYCGEKIKNAVCAAAEALFEIKQQYDNIPQGIKSENTDGYSVTYREYDITEIKKQEHQAMYLAMAQELSGTGLLYQGGG